MVFLTSFSKKWPFVLFIPKAELDRSDNHRAVCFASYVFPLAPGEWCETWSDLAGAAISAAILTLPLKSIHCVEKGAIVTKKERAKRAWWLAQLKDACRRTTGIYSLHAAAFVKFTCSTVSDSPGNRTCTEWKTTECYFHPLLCILGQRTPVCIIWH